MELKGKVALVTGAAQGIGKSIALLLAENGAQVVVADINLEKTIAVAEEIKQKNRESLALKMDVENFEEVNIQVVKILDKFSRLDILINNAGITKDNLIIRMKEEEWDKVINVNLKGAFNCIKAVVKIMMKQKTGSIVNISSVIGLIGNIGQVNYAASKAGLIGLTKTAAKELASWKIKVNAIAPGYIETAMTETLSLEIKDKLVSRIPLSRLGQPEDIAFLVLFLVSDRASYITGQVICVDGGLTM